MERRQQAKITHGVIIGIALPVLRFQLGGAVAETVCAKCTHECQGQKRRKSGFQRSGDCG
jgi:hypothetical protein